MEMGELRVGLEDWPLQKREVSELILHFLAIRQVTVRLGKCERKERLYLYGEWKFPPFCGNGRRKE